MYAEHEDNYWSYLQWGVAIGVGVAALMMVAPTYNSVAHKSPQVQATSHCRQIISALKLFASDHRGIYPDSDPRLAKTANEAFRVLIKDDVIQDERIFGCPNSLYNGDNNIGTAPDYPEAVGPNENHWMMVADQTEDSASSQPLVFENALSTALPLKWDAAAAGKPVQGRTWKGGKIVVGLNDNSVSVVRLSDPSTPILNLPPGTRILDIETDP